MTGHSPDTNPIRVLLVDDHELTREGLTDQLNAQPDIEVVAAVGTFAEALETITIVSTEVAVIDVQLPDGNGIALCKRIRRVSPATRCIIHTSTEIGPETAADAGAVAVVLKQLSGTELLATVRKASAR